jgi:hypothetical protein
MALPAAVAAFIGLVFSGAFVGVGLYWFAKGRDGRYSLTNVQLILWTGVIIGSYVGMAALSGGFLGSIPDNLMVLMGVSAGSYVTATGTRAAQEGKAKRTSRDYETKIAARKSAGASDIVSSEGGANHLSIPKLQVLFWTLVAILIYVLVVAGNFQSGTATLPDPGSGLVVLMGISHGAYLGNKLSDDPFG